MVGMRLLVSLALAVLVGLVAPAQAQAAASVADPRVVADSSMTSGQVTTWDCVWLGSYPQTFVDDVATVAALDAATGWDADGDLVYDGAAYRRLQKSDATYSSTSSSYWSWSDKASAAGYCYFRWEPVKWRVLETDGATALVVSDVALDGQRYNESCAGVTWETCTLRGWLNGTFWDGCLTIAQQGAVVEQTLVNADNSYYGTSGGANTTDNVFLLAESDVWSGADATRHGFATVPTTFDEARRCQTSDYSHAMGALNHTSSSFLGNCLWWLRSPGSISTYAAYVHAVGDADRNGNNVNDDYVAVRPALRISTSSDQVSYAGTVSSNGDVDEQAAPYSGGPGGGYDDSVEPGTVRHGTPKNGAYDLSISCHFGGTSTFLTEWKDSWLGGDYGGYHYTHELGRACSMLTAAAYKKDCIEGDLEALGFVGVKSYFPDEEGGYKSDWDECGCAFGIKTVEDPGTGRQVPLVVVVVRGTISNGEWLSNFNVADSSPASPLPAHEGLSRCRRMVLRRLASWAKEQDGKLEGLDWEHARVLLTGHSRGAAVAALMAASLDDGYELVGHAISPANVSAYTFASPTTSRLGQDKSLYDNVFNVVNPEDLVPKLPLGTWGYQRLGTTLVLPSKTNTGTSRYRSLRGEMNSVFRDIAKGNSYKPYPLGSATARSAALEVGAGVPTVGAFYDVGLWSYVGEGSPHELVEAIVNGYVMGGNKTAANVALALLAKQMPEAAVLLVANFAGDSAAGLAFQGSTTADHVDHGHMAETYVAWMYALDGLSDFASTHTGLMVACPVDVRVYAPDDELVAEIVDDKVNEDLLEDGLAAWVEGDAKYVDLPDEEAYRIELTPNDDGEMDVVLTHCSSEDGVMEQAGYDGLTLVEGESYELTTTGGATGETAIVEETSLVDSDGRSVAVDYSVSGDELDSITLAVTAEGSGVASCPVTATRGDYVTARAIPSEGGSFEGWYEDGALVSADADYRFRAELDRTLVARFSEPPVKAPSTISLAAQTKTYTGKAIAYTGKVTKSGSTGKVTFAYYSDAKCTKAVKAAYVKKAGTYYVRATVAADANYEKATSKAVKLTIAKAKNPITVTGKAATVKYSAVKTKAQALGVSKVATIAKAQGTKTYKVTKWTTAKAKKYISVNAKTGKVTVRKGTPKGTYKFKLRVSAAGNANYKAGSKTVTVKIVVK